MSMKRRTFLKGTVATGALGFALGAGLLKPTAVLAAYPEDAFKAEKIEDALNALFGSSSAKDGDIKIKAPDIAENGAVVPVTVSTKIQNVESISLLVEKNPQPLGASYNLVGNIDGFVATRIKMRETSDVIAVVKAGGDIFSAKKTVKVTIGGCGG